MVRSGDGKHTRLHFFWCYLLSPIASSDLIRLIVIVHKYSLIVFLSQVSADSPLYDETQVVNVVFDGKRAE